jgi:hypothetical protein
MGAAHLVRSNALLWSGRAQEAETALASAVAMAPDYQLLRRNQAYAAYLNRDRAAFQTRLEFCRGLWQPENTTRIFLEGLAEALDGRWSQVQARYAAALTRIRRERKAMHYTVRTSAFIEVSQTLHPKRRRMAQRDPAFRGLLPEPEPWPGD